MSTSRVLAGCVIHKDKIYVIGKSSNPSKHVHLFNVHKYGDLWSEENK